MIITVAGLVIALFVGLGAIILSGASFGGLLTSIPAPVWVVLVIFLLFSIGGKK